MAGRIRQTFLNGRDNLASAKTAVSEKTRRAARQTDYYVHDNAWKMMAVAAGMAFAAGFVLSRLSPELLGSKRIASDDKATPPRNQRRLNTWELVHSAIPLALFVWKATQSARCAKRGLA